jgi:hypothetical protein
VAGGRRVVRVEPNTVVVLHVLVLPDLERAERIGEFWSYPPRRTFAELLIDCEEDRTLRGCTWADVAGGRAQGAFLGTQIARARASRRAGGL